MSTKSRLPSRKTRVSFESYIADYVLLRLLRPYQRATSFRLIVVIPEGASTSVWSEAAFPVLDAMFPRKAMKQSDWDIDVVASKRSALKDAVTVEPRHLVLVSADDIQLLTDNIAAGADDVVHIGEISADTVKRVAKLRLNMSLADDTAEAIARIPATQRDYIMRPGANIRRAVEKLSKVTAAEVLTTAPPPPAKTDLPRLEDLHGFGEAKTWGSPTRERPPRLSGRRHHVG